MVSLGGWVVVDGSPTTLRDDTLTLDELFTIYIQRRRQQWAATKWAASYPSRSGFAQRGG